MKKVIVSTLCNRPGYTRQMLEALSRCYGVDQYTFLAFVEPGCPEVLEPLRWAQAEGYFKECVWKVNDRRLYVRANMFQALSAGFMQADRVIVLEDDCIVAPDALRYFEWALEHYRDDDEVFSISGYHRPGDPGRSAEDWAGYAKTHGGLVRRRCWFHPSGWATWIDGWSWIARNWPLPGKCWGRHVLHFVQRHRLFEVYPALPRVKNIGEEGGTSAHWLAPEQYREAHGNEAAWAGNWELPERLVWVEE